MDLLSPSLNGILTALLLFMFVGIWMWSWSAKRKPDFERMANLPLEEDLPETALKSETQSNSKYSEVNNQDGGSL